MEYTNKNVAFKVWSIVLSICLMLSCFPVVAFAQEEEPTTEVTEPCNNYGCEGVYVNGICSVCNEYQMPSIASDGTWEIKNAGQLRFFAEIVNCGDNKANARLADDIVFNTDVLVDGELNEYKSFKGWDPIKDYRGNFDGQNHTISGLLFVATSSDSTGGFFGSIYEASVENVGIIDSYFEGYSIVGGVVASAEASTVKNCYNKGTVKTYNDICGGVVGCAKESVIENCYNTGIVSGKEMVGGVVGATLTDAVSGTTSGVSTEETGGGIAGVTSIVSTLKGSYNSGTVIGTNNYIGGVLGYDGGNITVTDCRYLRDCAIAPSKEQYFGGIGVADEESITEDDASKTIAFDGAELESGKLTYMLNGGVTDGTQTWYQTLGTDDVPGFKGKTVYYDDYFGYTNLKKPALEDGIYNIATPENLLWFAAYVNVGNTSEKALLVNDIDMAGCEWTPICSTALYYSNTYSSGNYPDKGYSGVFDGGYHSIKNISVTSEAGKEASYGLFGTLSGEILNLGIDGFTYTHKASDMRVGAVAGQIIGGTVENCYVINSTITPGTNVAGGIAGSNYGGTVKSCFVYGSTVSAGRSGYIVADNRADTAGDRVGTLENCYSNGAVCGSYTGNEINCATLNARCFQTGEAAYILNGNKTEGIWRQGDGAPSFDGSPVYRNTCEGDEFFSIENESFDKHVIGSDYRCQKCGEYDKPEEKDGVYQIASVSNLFYYGEEGRNKDAVLVADLKIGTSENPVTDWQTVNIDNHGVLDGQMHTVEIYAKYSNFESDTSSSEAVGVFTGNYATLQNFIFKGYIKCNTTGRVGGVDADGYSVRFYNIISYMDVINRGTGYTGGIVGEFGQNYANGSVIDNCAVFAAVSGKGYTGGLVGAGWNGNQYWKITNSMFCGTVEGASGVTGGLVGYSKTDGGSSRIVIDNSYYIKGVNAVGGSDQALGTHNSTPLDSVDFKLGAAAYLVNGGVTNGTQKWYQTIGEQKFPGFEGGTVYRVSASGCSGDVAYTNDSTVKELVIDHKSNVGTIMENGFCIKCGAYEQCGGTGTESDPYKITNGGNLYWFAFEAVSKNNASCAVVLNNITVNERVLDEKGELIEAVSSIERTWSPIGFEYNGVFDGNNKVISGLYLNNTSDNQGFFRTVKSGTVKNVILKDSYFGGGASVGAIASANYGTIKDCTVYVRVNGTTFVGGIVGCNEENGSVSGCINEGCVTGRERTGGIIGNNNSSVNITNCTNNGTVTATGACVGGILGVEKACVYNCSNTGDVTGTECVGGIVGGANAHATTIENCENSGTVTGTENNVGGIFGSCRGNVVKGCNNSGSVSGSYYVGGIFGGNGCNTSNCVNTGAVSGKCFIGGINGMLYNEGYVKNCKNRGVLTSTVEIVGGINGEACGTTEECVNAGEIIGVNTCGGIVGEAISDEGAKIVNCYNAIDIYATGTDIGGIAGALYRGSCVENCYNYGKIVGDEKVGGVVGNNEAGSVNNCYYLYECASNSNGVFNGGVGSGSGDAFPKKSEQFDSGEVAYQLQKGVGAVTETDEDGNEVTKIPLVWGQTSSSCGSIPVLTSNEAYRVLPVMDGEAVVNYSVLKTGETNSDGVVDIYDYQNAVNIALSDNNLKSFSDKYDLNRDGVIDGFDISLAVKLGLSRTEINAFNEVLANGNVVCYIKNVDFDDDGVVDVLDISLLEKLLAGHVVSIVRY